MTSGEEHVPSGNAGEQAISLFTAVITLLIVSLFLLPPQTTGPVPSTTELVLEMLFMPALALVCGNLALKGSDPARPGWPGLLVVILLVAGVLALVALGVYRGQPPYWVRPEGLIVWAVYATAEALSVLIGYAAIQQRVHRRGRSGSRPRVTP